MSHLLITWRDASVCIPRPHIMWRQPEKQEFMWQTFFHLSISYTEFLSLPIRWMRHRGGFMNVYVGRVLHIYFQLRGSVNLLIANSGYLAWHGNTNHNIICWWRSCGRWLWLMARSLLSPLSVVSRESETSITTFYQWKVDFLLLDLFIYLLYSWLYQHDLHPILSQFSVWTWLV